MNIEFLHAEICIQTLGGILALLLPKSVRSAAGVPDVASSGVEASGGGWGGMKRKRNSMYWN